MLDPDFSRNLFPLSYGLEDLTNKSSFSMSIDLAGQKLILQDPRQVYEGNTEKHFVRFQIWLELAFPRDHLSEIKTTPIL